MVIVTVDWNGWKSQYSREIASRRPALALSRTSNERKSDDSGERCADDGVEARPSRCRQLDQKRVLFRDKNVFRGFSLSHGYFVLISTIVVLLRGTSRDDVKCGTMLDRQQNAKCVSPSFRFITKPCYYIDVNRLPCHWWWALTFLVFCGLQTKWKNKHISLNNCMVIGINFEMGDIKEEDWNLPPCKYECETRQKWFCTYVIL